MSDYTEKIFTARQYIETNNLHPQGEMEAYYYKERAVYEDFINDIISNKLSMENIIKIAKQLKLGLVDK